MKVVHYVTQSVFIYSNMSHLTTKHVYFTAEHLFFCRLAVTVIKKFILYTIVKEKEAHGCQGGGKITFIKFKNRTACLENGQQECKQCLAGSEWVKTCRNTCSDKCHVMAHTLAEEQLLFR